MFYSIKNWDNLIFRTPNNGVDNLQVDFRISLSILDNIIISHGNNTCWLVRSNHNRFSQYISIIPSINLIVNNTKILKIGLTYSCLYSNFKLLKFKSLY